MVACATCGKEFEATKKQRWRVQRAKPAYCDTCRRARGGMSLPPGTKASCNRCGKEITLTDKQRWMGAKRPVYCSSACVTAQMRSVKNAHAAERRVTKSCATCGEAFTVEPCRVVTALFCSMHCAGKATAGRVRSPISAAGRVHIAQAQQKRFATPAGIEHLRKMTMASAAAQRGKPKGSPTAETRHEMRLAAIRRPAFRGRTSIEAALLAEFKRRGWSFEEQCVFEGIGKVDFCFPDARLVVEADGDYWHRLPRVVRNDAWRDAALAIERFKVMRFWEKEIKADVAACVDKVEAFLKAHMG